MGAGLGLRLALSIANVLKFDRNQLTSCGGYQVAVGASSHSWQTDPSPEATMEVWKKMKTSGEPMQELTLFALMQETPSRLQPNRFSSWRKLVRVRAWVGQFVNNCRIHVNERSYRELGCQEIADVEIRIIKKAQQEAFHEDYKALVKQEALPSNNKLLSFKPVLDEDGLLRSDGRLRYADYLPFDARFPVILPRKNSVTRLIVNLFMREATTQREPITRCHCCRPGFGSCRQEKTFVRWKENAANANEGKQRPQSR